MKKRVFIFIFILLFALVLGLFLFFKREEKLEILGVSPSLGEGNVELRPVIKIDFNRKPKSVDYEIEPKAESEKRIDDKRMAVVLKKPLLWGTVYRVFLKKEGEVFFSWHFKTRGKTEEEIVEEELEVIEKKYPLFNKLPYTAENFRISYKEGFCLEVIYKGDLEKVKKEVFEWIKNHGVEPTSHRYEWVKKKAL